MKLLTLALLAVGATATSLHSTADSAFATGIGKSQNSTRGSGNSTGMSALVNGSGRSTSSKLMGKLASALGDTTTQTTTRETTTDSGPTNLDKKNEQERGVYEKTPIGWRYSFSSSGSRSAWKNLLTLFNLNLFLLSLDLRSLFSLSIMLFSHLFNHSVGHPDTLMGQRAP